MIENRLSDTVIRPGMTLQIPTAATNKTDYAAIGKALEEVLDDIDKLESAKKLYKMIGD